MTESKHTKHISNSKNLFEAFYYASCGLKAAFQAERAFRQEVFLTLGIIPLALFLGVTSIERTVLIGSWLLVLLVEIINSSIEAIVDRISLEIHPLSKKIKDMGSAAVLVSITNAIAMWVIILVNHYM